MKAYRASLLWFETVQGCPQPRHEADGLLVLQDGPGPGDVARVRDVGPHHELIRRYPGVDIEHFPGRLIAPGFVDLHIHYPQTDVIASPADGLLPWLEQYTFPHEARFADPRYAAGVAQVFLGELQRHGVTTSLTFATSHPASVDAFMAEARQRGLRTVAGKVLQDRHSPDGVRDQTEQGLRDTEDLIARWHGVDRLGYAITPRFAPSCSDAQMRGAGELARQFPDVWVQSHVAENVDEVRWVRELYPRARSYLDVYRSFGLLRERAVYAHCIYLDDTDCALLRETGTAAAISPTSNLFLGSGFFDYERAGRMGFRHGLASDVGGGTSFSPFRTMMAAYYVGRSSVLGPGQNKPGVSLAPSDLWWQHTAGAAQAMGLDGVVGNLLPGTEADFVLLNPAAIPLLQRKCSNAQDLEQLLFAWIALGDDRAIEKVHIASRGWV